MPPRAPCFGSALGPIGLGTIRRDRWWRWVGHNLRLDRGLTQPLDVGLCARELALDLGSTSTLSLEQSRQGAHASLKPAVILAKLLRLGQLLGAAGSVGARSLGIVQPLSGPPRATDFAGRHGRLGHANNRTSRNSALHLLCMVCQPSPRTPAARPCVFRAAMSLCLLGTHAPTPRCPSRHPRRVRPGSALSTARTATVVPRGVAASAPLPLRRTEHTFYAGGHPWRRSWCLMSVSSDRFRRRYRPM